ncbi:hypothetical protein PP176A_1004 [Sporanaerobacter sp. PP17-6a]|nr:hypothetical protein PP176A_1004 [Sporanaerobacter sp. PP17-6a]
MKSYELREMIEEDVDVASMFDYSTVDCATQAVAVCCNS